MEPLKGEKSVFFCGRFWVAKQNDMCGQGARRVYVTNSHSQSNHIKPTFLGGVFLLKSPGAAKNQPPF